jgi:hypothetical protein
MADSTFGSPPAPSSTELAGARLRLGWQSRYRSDGVSRMRQWQNTAPPIPSHVAP